MNASSTLNDTELLPRIAAGEQAAFEQLFNAWYASLVLFAESYSVGRLSAEEIVSEAFVKFWDARGQFQAIGQIKNWLYTVIRNDSLMALRKDKVQQKHAQQLQDIAAATEGDDAKVAEAELVAIVMEQIRQLPEKCRQIMLLTYQEGLSSKEIAERLHITVTNVTSQRARAIQLLRLALAEKYPLLAALSMTVLLERVFA